MKLAEWAVIFGLAAGCVLGACTGKNPTDSASGGAASTAGAAGGAIANGGTGGSNASGSSASSAGSGEAGAGDMLPPAQAGVSLSIGQSLFPLAGTECPAIRSYQLGTPAPNTTDPGESLTSGVAGTSIQCSVTVQQSGYLFSAQIRGVTSDGNAVSLVLTTGSTVGASSGSADVSVYTAALIQTYSSPAPCQFQILSQQIKPGSIWASFSCEQVASPPSGLCQLTGTVLLENCAQF